MNCCKKKNYKKSKFHKIKNILDKQLNLVYEIQQIAILDLDIQLVHAAKAFHNFYNFEEEKPFKFRFRWENYKVEFLDNYRLYTDYKIFKL